MPDSLSVLQARRAELLRSIADLKDRRPGSIVGAVWRCGKSNCHCAPPDAPVMGRTCALPTSVSARPALRVFSAARPDRAPRRETQSR